MTKPAKIALAFIVAVIAAVALNFVVANQTLEAEVNRDICEAKSTPDDQCN